jgi:hypothetical protein
VRLVCKSTLHSNVRQRLVGQEHHFLGTFDSASAKITEGRLADSAAKGVGKIAHTQPRRPCEIFDSDAVGEISFEILQYPAGLPGRKWPGRTTEPLFLVQIALGP